MVRQQKERQDINPTYTFQISVDNFVVVQIIKAAGNSDQLRDSERKIEL